MIHAQGASFEDLDTAIAKLKTKVSASIGDVMDTVAAHLAGVRTAAAPPPEQTPPPAVSLDALASIATLWLAEVNASLIPALIEEYVHGGLALASSATGAARRRVDDVTRDEMIASPLAAEWLAGARKRLGGFSDELWATARAQLLEGFLEGESIDELKARLHNVAHLTSSRAEAIARTEVISASNAGSLAMVHGAGFTGRKRWLHTPDARTRHTHRTVDPDVVPLGEKFHVGEAFLDFPGDPDGPPDEVINCRCSLGYILDREPLTAAGETMATPICEWIGVITMEGTPTGDGRMFAPGALTWADLPLPLLWQKETGDGHDNAVIIGNITEITRQGPMIAARGTFDMAGQDGIEAYRMVRDRYLQGISVDADDFTASDIEYQYGPGIDEQGNATVALTVIHAARIRAATLCAIPAFVEAKIQAIPPAGDPMPVNPAPGTPPDMPVSPVPGEPYIPADYADSLTAAAVPIHHTKTSDKPWNAAANLKRLDSPISVATAKNMFAWYDTTAVDNGMLNESDCKFPHHDVDTNGRPGPANLAACSAGLAALHGARSGTTIPMADRAKTYNHLAAHLRDAGEKPAPYAPAVTDSPRTRVDIRVKTPAIPSPPTATSQEVITAAAYTLTIPDVPPATWFDEPAAGEITGALTVTDQGRVYGYLAPANVAHRSFNHTVTVPMGNVDYSLYMGRETLVEGGARVVTGALTMDCGHASIKTADSHIALDHYDNACSIVATVRIGENAHGVWVAGAVTPGITASQITRMMACQLSGDWRPHRQRKGWREFAGALLVPVPGFAMARSAPSVRIDDGALVASSVPVHYEPTTYVCPQATTTQKMSAHTLDVIDSTLDDCGCFTSEPGETDWEPDLGNVVALIAESVGLDLPTRMATLRDTVNQRRQ